MSRPSRTEYNLPLQVPDREIIAGDVITAVGEKPVTSLDELLETLERHQPGETVKLTVLRSGKPVELSVRLGLADQLQ